MSSTEPPWEWVSGDPIVLWQWGLATGLFLCAIAVLGAILIPDAIGIAAWPTLPYFFISPAYPPFLLFTLLGAESAYLYYFSPARRPLVVQLGISPIGLRVRLPLRTYEAPWSKVSDIGLGGVYFAHRGRFRLTDGQMERLSRFLTPH